MFPANTNVVHVVTLPTFQMTVLIIERKLCYHG